MVLKGKVVLGIRQLGIQACLQGGRGGGACPEQCCADPSPKGPTHIHGTKHAALVSSRGPVKGAGMRDRVGVYEDNIPADV